ncbi:MarR family winged helix-turn-helix transcriptional regulator [Planctomicrobium sp. SH668]|uniref:MarR family winged helix-turn-helix transcriptional regulator n=1 Tax=Planctomicrobium sp. SH668 TaxID=3448126 RepID=UPI003F5C00BB
MTIEKRAEELGQYVQVILKGFRKNPCTASDIALTSNEIRVIEILGESGDQIMRSLAEQLCLAVNSVTSLIDGMELKGLVSRQRSTTDRRVVFVQLTENGNQIWSGVNQYKMELHRALLLPLTTEEQVQLLGLFRKIAEGAPQFESIS